MEFDFDPWLLVIVPVAIAGLYYFGLPLLIKSQQRLAADPEFVPFELDDLDPAVADYLDDRTRDLEALGFGDATHLELIDFVPNATAHLVTLVQPRAGDKAMVSVFTAGGPTPTRVMCVEFSTRYGGGEVFDTSNSPELNAFPPEEPNVRSQLPGVRDVGRLYALHRFVMDRSGVAGRKITFPPGGAADYLRTVTFPGLFEKLTRWGWVALDANRGQYVYTLTGAYRVTWGLLQPMKAIRLGRVRRAERELLAEFERVAVE